MKKTTTAIRLDNHEKLCRIMQKQTHDKINALATQINRLEKILIGAAALIISGLGMTLIELLTWFKKIKVVFVKTLQQSGYKRKAFMYFKEVKHIVQLI